MPLLFEKELTGGHPNSLGNTLKVVDIILADKSKFDDLLECYKSKDAVVRLRVSSALKRICKAEPDWVYEQIKFLLDELPQLDQPSAKWTLAQIFMWLEPQLTQVEKQRAVGVMKHNLVTEMDWIVQNTTAESLAYFARSDPLLKSWLLPQLERQSKDKHGSVARRAVKLQKQLQAE